MQQKKRSYFFLALVFALAAGGVTASFWPLEVLGVLLAALAAHPAYAVGLGLLLDLAYGAPVGQLHALLFPFTELALCGLVLRYFGKKYFFDTSAQDTL